MLKQGPTISRNGTEQNEILLHGTERNGTDRKLILHVISSKRHVIKPGMGKELWHTLKLLLYWLTLKDSLEGWLVESGSYCCIRPHTIMQSEQTIEIL